MINLNIEGKTWPEVTQQLAELISEKQAPDTSAELEHAKGIIQTLRMDLDASHKRIAELEQLLATPAEEAPDENPTPDAATTASEQTVTATDTEPDPVTDLSTTSEPEQPKYDKAQVREFLAEARNKGVNITDVLKPFGGRFPAVKEEDYPALMEATKAALAEKGAK